MIFTKEDSARTKGVATILLLFHHLFLNDRGFDIQLWFLTPGMLKALATAARVCVWIFVFISAYGVTSLFYRKPESQTVQSFVFARWFSLMKGYWFVWILAFLSLLFFGKNPVATYENSVVNMFLDCFAWADLFGTPSLLGAWWYMCFAQLQVFLIPVLIIYCRKVGGITAFFTMFIGAMFVNSAIVSPSGGDYMMYIYASLFGVLCVQYDFFGKIRKRTGFPAVARWLAVLCVVILGIWVRFFVVSDTFAYNSRGINRVTYAISAVGIALLVYLLKGKCKFADKAFLFMGNHSGNVYLIHMFLVKYFGKLIYITRSTLGAVLILLVASCLISALIEWIKKQAKYDRLMKKLKDRLEHCISVVATEGNS